MYFERLALLFTLTAYAWVLPAHAFSLTAAESGLLDSREDSRTLPCEVALTKPHLELDLRFHASLVATLSRDEVRGGSIPLHAVVRLIPKDQPNRIFVLRNSVRLPKVPGSSNFEFEVLTAFLLGPGGYQLDYVLYDTGDNSCSSHLDIAAKIPNQLKAVPLGMAPNTADAVQGPFAEPSAAVKKSPHPLAVKVLVSFSTGNPAATQVRPDDIRAVTSILRSLLREPRFGRYSVTVFSVEEQRVLYQSGFLPHIDFAALQKAVRDVRLGTVDYRRLQDPNGTRKFLAKLFLNNVGPESADADAVVIVSPRLNIEQKMSREALKAAERPSCPLFYLDYAPDPRSNPWPDPIGAAVKFYRGLHYSIAAPDDLGKAFGGMMTRLTSR